MCTHIFHWCWEREKPVEFWALSGEMHGGMSAVCSSQQQCWQPHGAQDCLHVPGLKSHSWSHSGHCQ